MVHRYVDVKAREQTQKNEEDKILKNAKSFNDVVLTVVTSAARQNKLFLFFLPPIAWLEILIVMKG